MAAIANSFLVSETRERTRIKRLTLHGHTCEPDPTEVAVQPLVPRRLLVTRMLAQLVAYRVHARVQQNATGPCDQWHRSSRPSRRRRSVNDAYVYGPCPCRRRVHVHAASGGLVAVRAHAPHQSRPTRMCTSSGDVISTTSVTDVPCLRVP